MSTKLESDVDRLFAESDAAVFEILARIALLATDSNDNLSPES